MLRNLRLMTLLGVALVTSSSRHVVEANSGLKLTYGEFETTDAGRGLGYDITGTALMVRSSSGTKVWTQVVGVGLNANSTYGSHVHNLPCALGGGGHYKIDPTEPTTIEANEIWPILHTDQDGIGYGFAESTHIARVEAQSIVVHASDGTRIACADLSDGTKGPTTTCGEFELLPAGEELGLKISGYAIMRRDSRGTHVCVQVRGLNFSGGVSYPAHVHDLPCDVNSGGGHYKIDPTESGTVEENEIWPTVVKGRRRTGVGYASVDHIARPEAQSVVIHHPETKARLACATLVKSWPTRLVTTGTFEVTARGHELGYGRLRGTATMTRNSRGQTFVSVSVKGLDRRTTYAAHVHALPCYMGGGPHYKIDPSVSGTVEENEIWPIIRTNSRGRGRGWAWSDHLARPEAQTIVIHDPDTGDRVACANLYLD
jgi:hypothetical protein